MVILSYAPFLAPILHWFQPKSILKSYTEFWVIKNDLGMITLEWLNCNLAKFLKPKVAPETFLNWKENDCSSVQF